MDIEKSTIIPRSQIVYGEIIYWFTITAALICLVGPVIATISTNNNVLNPHYLFKSIFEGKPVETIWTELGTGFPGGHFYLEHFTSGDGFTQFGLVLGCSCAFWALLATTVLFFKEKNYFFACLSLWVAFLVLLSVAGYISYH